MDNVFFFTTLNIWAVLMAFFVTLSAGRGFLKALGLLALLCALGATVAPFVGGTLGAALPWILIGLKGVALVCGLLILALTRSYDTRMIALLLSAASGVMLLLQVWTPRLLR